MPLLKLLYKFLNTVTAGYIAWVCCVSFHIADIPVMEAIINIIPTLNNILIFLYT